MFWLSSRKEKEAQIDNNKISPIYDGDRGLNDLHGKDAELRVWLPETLKLAINEVAMHSEKTVSAYMRELFVMYLYGAHELLCMSKNKTGIFHTENPSAKQMDSFDSQIRFSRARSVDYIPGLGKNIVPLKLFLHEKIKADLQELADKATLPLSQFVRELLVSHFLGHTAWSERQQMLSTEHIAVTNQWEAGNLTAHSVREPSEKEEAELEGKIETIYL
jgi:hypothetical protein